MSPTGEGMRKDHHTIPRFVLRNFADHSGSLYEFDLDLLKRYKRSPGQVAHTPEFYTIDTVEGPSDAVEKILAEIESDAAKVVENIKAPSTKISTADLDSLVLFVALQLTRVPAHRETLTDFVYRTMDKAKMVAISQKLDPEASTKQLQAEMDFTRSRNFMNPFMLETLEPIFRLMRRRGWSLVRREMSAPEFVISDSPVVISDLRPDTGPPYTPLLPYGEDSKIVLPLSPDMCLVSYYDPKLSNERVLPGELIEVLNYQQMKSALRRLYGRTDNFSWGRLQARVLRWPDYIEDQRGAREAQAWKSDFQA